MSNHLNHTPGPWRFDHEGNIFGGDGNSLLTGGIEFAGEHDESSWVAVKRNEDARLIAAAPDMLTALHDIEWLFCDQEDINDHGGPNDAMRALQIVRAAIAKAEGKEP